MGERINKIVLYCVEDGDLAKGEEGGAENGDKPVRAVFERPREPEQGRGNQDGADVSKRKAEFGFRDVVVAGCERIVDGVDSGNNQPDGEEKADAGSEIHEADLGSGEAVLLTVDGLKVGVEAVNGAEDDRLVDGHGENDGLREENSQGPAHGGGKFGPERSSVFVSNVIFVTRVFFEMFFALFENYGRVGFFEEEESDDCITGAKDSQDPEHPSPTEILNDEAAEKRAERGTEQGT